MVSPSPARVFVEFSHQDTSAWIMNTRFGSGGLPNEFGGYITTVSETVPVKFIGWLELVDCFFPDKLLASK